MSRNAIDRLRATNPIPGDIDVPREWREALLEQIATLPQPSPASSRSRRAVVVLAFAAALTLFAIPSYGIARDVIAWVRGEPAPQAIVEEFESYTPQLGYQPDPAAAILVAVDRTTRLYSTANDKGSYCLALTAPGRPTGEGGTCINPDYADEPLIAGTLGATAGDDNSSTHFIAGRSKHPDAHRVSFASPNGQPIVRPIGFDGFFVAAVEVPRSACGAGDWRPIFRLYKANGKEVASGAITLLFSHQSPGVCGFTPPHPPSVR